MKRTPLKRKTGLKARGRKYQRELGALDVARQILRDRNNGRCEVQSPGCPHGWHLGAHAHHRYPSDRDRGVHDPDRMLWLCPGSHRWTHENPALAREKGWLMRDGDTNEGVSDE